MQRKLAAILAADVVGYSRLMQEDEAGTLRSLRALRSTILEPTINEAGGRVFKNTGDGLLAEFSSAVAAVQCSVEIQSKIASAQLGEALRPLALRIAVNLGDVVIEEGDVFGDGVNIAARLESVAQPGSICVSASVHEQVHRKLPLEFEELGPQNLKNIAEPILAYLVWPENSKKDLVKRPEVMVDPAKIRVAVLPFENLSGDPEQTYFSDGITDDIITELSRYRHMAVVPRNSAFSFQGKNVDQLEIGRRLGANYIVQGSVRKSGNRIRLSAQLVDIKTVTQIWSERYDRSMEDIFAVQDELARRVVTTLDRQLDATATEIAKRKRSSDVNAYDMLLRGWDFERRFTIEDSATARELYQQAIARDPNYAPAYVAMAFNQMMDYGSEGDQEWKTRLVKAAWYANKALQLDPNDAFSHQACGYAYVFQKQYEKALAHTERSISLNPNSGDVYITHGLALTYAGRAEEAARQMQSAISFEPFPPASYEMMLALSLYTLGDYERAASKLARLPAGERWFNTVAAACCAMAGNSHAAGEHASSILAVDPQFSAEVYICRFHPYQNQSDSNRFLEGLLKAGLRK